MVFSLEILFGDILIRVLGMLPLKDVLSMRQVSKRLKAVTHLRAIWHDQFCFEVLSKGLPIPGTVIPLPEISALDLEWRTRLAVQVQKTWTGPTCPLRPVLLRSIPAAQQAALQIGGRELLTLHADRFIAWRLNGTKKLATDNIMHEQSLAVGSAREIYKDCGGSSTIAIADSSGGDVFILESSFSEPPLRRHYQGRVLGLFNQFILTSTSPESGACIDIYNWVSTSFGSATIKSDPSFFGKLITFSEFDSDLLIFRETCIELYPMLTLPEEGQTTILKPIQSFLLPFYVQSPVVCSPCTPLNLPNSDFALPPNSKLTKALSKSICYQIAGMQEIRGFILVKNTGSEVVNAPPFHVVGNPCVTVKDCACICVGHSGRGLWLDSYGNVFRCNTVSVVTPGGGNYRTLDMEQWSLTPLCTLPGILKDREGDLALDFDEGMGRIVYCNESGLVSIVDVV